MNVVTFETAKKLKEAGFPQPEYKTGQVWYGTAGLTTQIVGTTYGKDSPEFFNPHTAVTQTISHHFDFTFAPSATDILKELGRTFNLYYDSMPNAENPSLWTCFCDGLFVCVDPQYHENPAEACAASWLQKNEKS